MTTTTHIPAPHAPAKAPASTPDVFERAETFTTWDDDYYHPIALRHYDRAVAWMLREMRVPPGGLVLDAGCGPGVHSIRAAKHGFQVRAIDLSHSVLEEARRRAESAGVAQRIAFEQADLTRLSFPDASFDHVFSWGVVIHIPGADAALQELARIVRPGGRLALHVTNRAAWDHALEALGRAITGKKAPLESHALGVGKWYELSGERLWVWRFDARALAQRMEQLGFRLVRRRAAEFTEIQWRTRGVARRALLHLNNLWFGAGLPAGPACTNLYVFEKNRT